MIFQNRVYRLPLKRPKSLYLRKRDRGGVHSYLIPSAGNALTTAIYQLEKLNKKPPPNFRLPPKTHSVYMNLPKRASKTKVYRQMAIDTAKKGIDAAEKLLDRARKLVEEDIAKKNMRREDLGGGQWFRDRFKQ